MQYEKPNKKNKKKINPTKTANKLKKMKKTNRKKQISEGNVQYVKEKTKYLCNKCFNKKGENKGLHLECVHDH